MQREQGAMLVELIVAVLIVSVVAVGFSSAMVGSINVETSTQARNRLSTTSEILLEQLRTDTAWMREDECEDIEDGDTCDISEVLESSGALVDEQHGELTVISAVATAIDSEDDGTGDDDEDQNEIDFFRVEMKVDFAQPYRDLISDKVEALESVSTIAAPTLVGNGALTLQLCRIENQVDVRVSFTSCDDKREIDMNSDFLRLEAGAGASDQQAFVCAHPDHYMSTWNDAAQVATKPHLTPKTYPVCRNATGAFADPDVVPDDYEAWSWSDAWNTVFNRTVQLVPVQRPLAGNLPGSTDRFIQTVIGPVTGVDVTITHAGNGDTQTEATNGEGRVHFVDLEPGTYDVSVSAAAIGDYELSTSMSIPGRQVTVDSGTENSAMHVYAPIPDGEITFKAIHRNITFPWHRVGEDPVLDKKWVAPSSGVKTLADVQPHDWDEAAWGPHAGTLVSGKRTYTLPDGSTLEWNTSRWGPGPWPYTTPVTDTAGKCLMLMPVPQSRLLTNPKKFCGAAGSDEVHVTGLAPGLYRVQFADMVTAVHWNLQDTPGFIWIDEDGTSYPSQPKLVSQMCSKAARQEAAMMFDPSLFNCEFKPSDNVDFDAGGGGGT